MSVWPLPVSQEQEAMLRRYADAVVQAAENISLTSARDRGVFFERHVLDAVTFLSVLPQNWRSQALNVIDVGSGNGVPGMVFGLLCPLWRVILLDSDTKKTLFLDTFCKLNDINNVKVIVDRAETLAQSDLRESCDLAIARALGPITVTLELVSAFVKPEGSVIVSRGTSPDPNMERVPLVASLLGLTAPDFREYSVGDLRFSALRFKKARPTPTKYPRRVGKPSKSPL
jgi:16S rRNA (guanine527-N7)-methyltransferase